MSVLVLLVLACQGGGPSKNKNAGRDDTATGSASLVDQDCDGQIDDGVISDGAGCQDPGARTPALQSTLTPSTRST